MCCLLDCNRCLFRLRNYLQCSTTPSRLFVTLDALHGKSVLGCPRILNRFFPTRFAVQSDNCGGRSTEVMSPHTAPIYRVTESASRRPGSGRASFSFPQHPLQPRYRRHGTTPCVTACFALLV